MGKHSYKNHKPLKKTDDSVEEAIKDSFKASTVELMQEAFDMGFQACADLLVLTLHDADVMRRDAFGEVRVSRVYEGINKYSRIYGAAWSTDREADYLQDKLDEELKAILKDKFVPFRVRHKLLRIPGYGKHREEWL